MFRKTSRKQVVVVYEFNLREATQFSKYWNHLQKEEDEEEYERSEDGSSTWSRNDSEFILFLPVLEMIKNGLNVKVILFYRRNFYHSENVQEFIQEKLKIDGHRIYWEIAKWMGDLWFLLGKNIENLDIIHFFCSEKQRAPEKVCKFLKEKKSEHLLKYHYTGSSFERYNSIVCSVLSRQFNEIKDKANFLNKVNPSVIIEENEEEKKDTNNSNDITINKNIIKGNYFY